MSTRIITGFRDHSLYKGHQVFLYKRAQIFAADLWGAFKGQGYGEFNDIGSITIFADYIVPAVLRQLGILKYNSTLASIIEANNEIGSGTEEEVELRACSIYAVEKMRELIHTKSGKQVGLFFLPFPEAIFTCICVYQSLYLQGSAVASRSIFTKSRWTHPAIIPTLLLEPQRLCWTIVSQLFVFEVVEIILKKKHNPFQQPCPIRLEVEKSGKLG